jgi:hypothetical protein
MKLIGIEREIKEYDVESKNVIQEINIDAIPNELLLKVVVPKADDPLLYDGYILTGEQLEKINLYLKDKLVPMFETCYYVLECSGIYEY